MNHYYINPATLHDVDRTIMDGVHVVSKHIEDISIPFRVPFCLTIMLAVAMFFCAGYACFHRHFKKTFNIKLTLKIGPIGFIICFLLSGLVIIFSWKDYADNKYATRSEYTVTIDNDAKFTEFYTQFKVLDRDYENNTWIIVDK